MLISFVPDAAPLLQNRGLATQGKNLNDGLLVIIVGLAFVDFKVVAFASFVFCFFANDLCIFATAYVSVEEELGAEVLDPPSPRSESVPDVVARRCRSNGAVGYDYCITTQTFKKWEFAAQKWLILADARSPPTGQKCFQAFLILDVQSC